MTHQLTGKVTYTIQIRQQIYDSDLLRLNTLYGPFLGAKATQLYHLLWQTKWLAENTLQLNGHQWLFEQLALSPAEFVKIRQRLESVGLLQSFVKTTDDQTIHYLLKAPYATADFFADDILTGLLYRYVGDDQIQQIKAKLLGQPDHYVGYQDISASLVDVYGLSALKSTDQRVPKTKNSMTLSAITTFDYDSFVAFLRGMDLDQQLQNVDFRNYILQRHLLYHAGEQEMADLVAKTIALDTRKVQKEQLDQLLLEQFNAKNKQVAVPVDQNVTIDDSHLTPEEQTVAKLAKQQQYQQISLLFHEIQTKRGVTVTKSDQVILSELDRFNLPKEVINVYIYYQLVTQNKPVIFRNEAMTTLKDWQVKKVQTAEEAILALNAFNDQKVAKQAKKAATYPVYKSGKIESKPIYQDNQETVTPEELQKLLDQLDQ